MNTSLGFQSIPQKTLQQIGSTIKQTVPKTAETIIYGIPSFNLQGRYLIYFAGYKKYIDVYPGRWKTSNLKKTSLHIKHQSKARFKFPLDKPVPLEINAIK